MTDYKRLIYKVEDTFILGKSLPVVALRQLPKLAQQFETLPNIPEYISGTQRAMAEIIMDFYNENKTLIDDERELLDVFKKVCKLHKYSHYTLRLFESR